MLVRLGFHERDGLRDPLGQCRLARLAPLLQRPRLHLEQRPDGVRRLRLDLDLIDVQRRELVQRIALGVADVAGPAHGRRPRRDPAPERLVRVALQPPLLRRVAVLREVEGHHLRACRTPRNSACWPSSM
jgi:hypothetical protein